MEALEAYLRLRIAIPKRPELRFNTPTSIALAKEMGKTMNPYLGFCYIATEVFCHLVEEAKPWSVGRSHFWAEFDGKIYDPTADQFNYLYPYHDGNKTHFKCLSQRASLLLNEVLQIRSPEEAEPLA